MATAVEAVFQEMFADWGLPADLFRRMFDRFVAEGADEAAGQVVAMELEQTPEFAARFPTYKKMAEEGRAITVGQWLGYEKQVREYLSVLGPQAQEKFTSPDRIGDMLYGSVSANEVQERVNMAAYASSTAPADVRAALTSRYGLTQADLTSYWLEPDETTTMLQTRMGAARIVGAATLNDMNATTAFAEELAREGVDYAQARQAYAEASRARGLEGEQGLSQEDIVGSRLGRSEAATRVERAQRARKARFGDQGGAESGREGISGLGSSANV